MYKLSLERQNALNLLFNPLVSQTLGQHMNPISIDLLRAYSQKIKQHYEANATSSSFVWIKKSRPNFPFSILMVKDEPFLVLPCPKEWKTNRQSNAVPKTLISLTTGELKFLKVYRPESKTDTYPEYYSKSDFEHRQKWGQETERHLRVTDHGHKYYLLMPHYGQSFEKFLNDPTIKPHHMLNAIIQVANQLKHMHDQGFLHLDLKPSNMMYDIKKNIARLIDFETMVPDQTVVPIARGIIPYMHPERLVYETEARVRRRSGNITCTKTEDIFSFLRVIEDMLFIAQGKETTELGKTVLTFALDEFRKEAYQGGLNLDGSRTAKPLEQMPTIDRVISMLNKTAHEYQVLLPKQLPPQQHSIYPHPQLHYLYRPPTFGPLAQVIPPYRPKW